MKRLTKSLLRSLVLVSGLVVIMVLVGYFLLRGSLPRLSGEILLPALGGPVVVERDSLGVPSIKADNRRDLAIALGFIHAQERFFQMDLLRRSAGGELSELFGKATLEFDRERRLHQFRKRARGRIKTLKAGERSILESYAQGVNAGLKALTVRPFEYLILGIEPVPWRIEDSLLVLYAMFFDLQDETGRRDRDLGIMRSVLPERVFSFFTRNGSEWEAPLDGTYRPILDIPSPEDFSYLEKGRNLQSNRVGNEGRRERADFTQAGRAIADYFPGLEEGYGQGSNNWAAAGNLAAAGGALLANDAHLHLSVPNIWYRAAFNYFAAEPPEEEGGAKAGNPRGPGNEIHVYGVTLPGLPVMVIGSNTKVAWSFTNAYADTTDLIIIEKEKAGSNRYRTPEGLKTIQREREIIKVKGGEPVPMEVRSTIWGPLFPAPGGKGEWAIRWIAHNPKSVNLEAMKLEEAGNLKEVFAIANKSGMPVQNLVAADSGGNIGWTLMGSLFRRRGYDGFTPVSLADGSKREEGLLPAADYPRISSPGVQRIWTANNRVVGGEMLKKIGDGGYHWASRAYQIKEKLEALKNPREKDMLTIQLDDEAVFLRRWRKLFLKTLKKAGTIAESDRKELETLLLNWSGKADLNAVGYTLVRDFRSLTAERVLLRLLKPCYEKAPDFQYSNFSYEEPLWLVVSQQPAYLADAGLGSWQAELEGVAADLLNRSKERGESLVEQRWGKRNTLAIRHPLSRAIPLFSRWLDMPAEEVPGDRTMPRVAGPAFGASERMVVSPGKEEEGIFHMPCGQSGHPLSPHYRDGHKAWVKGLPTPFLPGKTQSILHLLPSP